VTLITEEWVFNDPRWRVRVADDPRWTYREALRRAVDLRDALAEGSDPGARAVMLVDVLNHLGELAGHHVEGSEDLWTLP